MAEAELVEYQIVLGLSTLCPKVLSAGDSLARQLELRPVQA